MQPPSPRPAPDLPPFLDPSCSHVVHGENLEVIGQLPDGCATLVYLDPPFNTGRRQRRQRLRTVLDPEGDRIGFGGRRYRTERLADAPSYEDRFDDYLGFLEPRLREARRLLAPDGSLYVHLDYREVHYVKVLLDRIFGRDCFVNEIIWAYDFGARGRRRWPAKHDNILFYSREPDGHFFDLEAVDRIPYLAPGLAGPEKAARGKLPTDTWWNTIVSPTGREKTGYPTQKPLAILERIVKASSRPGDLVVDFFAGSGSFGEAALRHGRRFLLVDNNPEAIEVMRRRFAGRAEVRFSEARSGRRSGPTGRADARRPLPADGAVCGGAPVLRLPGDAPGAHLPLATGASACRGGTETMTDSKSSESMRREMGEEERRTVGSETGVDPPGGGKRERRSRKERRQSRKKRGKR